MNIDHVYKVGIIEDEIAIADMYIFRLENEGYEVQHANNGLEGYALCESFRPDAILLDLRMPVMSGDEMLEKIRQTEWGSKIRVIVLTNISRDEAPSILRFLNVDRYIVKAHSTPKDISDTVASVLRQDHKRSLF